MNILVYAKCKFPYGEAFSERLMNLCRLLSINNNVHLIVAETDNKKQNGKEIFKFEKFTYQVLNLKKNVRGRHLLKNEKIRKENTETVTDAIRNCIMEMKADLLVSSASPDFYRDILRTCKEMGKKCIVEQCEWFDKSNYRFGRLSLRYIREKHLRKHEFPSSGGIICISRYFYDYYQPKNPNVIRIPTILDVKNTPYATDTYNEKIRLVFMGSFGFTKDNLTGIIKALSRNEKLRERIQLMVYGPSKEEVIKSIQKEQYLIDAGSSVVINGRIPQEEVHSILMQADYSVFIRPHRRSSDAAFPTKLGESMCAGTPVITNNTGDVGLYLKNNLNGFIISDESSEGIEKLLLSLTEISKEEYRKLRLNARKTAEDSFDFRCYDRGMEELLHKIVN